MAMPCKVYVKNNTKIYKQMITEGWNSVNLFLNFFEMKQEIGLQF